MDQRIDCPVCSSRYLSASLLRIRPEIYVDFLSTCQPHLLPKLLSISSPVAVHAAAVIAGRSNPQIRGSIPHSFYNQGSFGD